MQVECKLCGHNVEKDQTYHCLDRGEVTYECVDEERCKQIREDGVRLQEETAKREFEKKYGFAEDDLEKVERGSRFFKKKGTKRFFKANGFLGGDYTEIHKDTYDHRKLREKYCNILTRQDFKDVYGFEPVKLTSLCSDTSFRDGGNMLYYKMENDKYVFYTKNNLSGYWKRVDNDELHDHYYYKYICKDEDEIKEYNQKKKRKNEQFMIDFRKKCKREYEKQSSNFSSYRVEPVVANSYFFNVNSLEL